MSEPYCEHGGTAEFPCSICERASEPRLYTATDLERAKVEERRRWQNSMAAYLGLVFVGADVDFDAIKPAIEKRIVEAALEQREADELKLVEAIDAHDKAAKQLREVGRMAGQMDEVAWDYHIDCRTILKGFLASLRATPPLASGTQHLLDGLLAEAHDATVEQIQAHIKQVFLDWPTRSTRKIIEGLVTDLDFMKGSPALDPLLREKEETVAKHIRKGANDGCQCEPCISTRGLLAKARLEEARTIEKEWNNRSSESMFELWFVERIAQLEAEAKERK